MNTPGGKGDRRRPCWAEDHTVEANWPKPSPDWSKAPPWAEWFALAPAGAGWFYSRKPIASAHRWDYCGFMAWAGSWPGARLNWRETLQARPQ